VGIKEDMPVLARHEGQWAGSYIHVDVEGRELSRHDSFVTCAFPEDGSYLQRNRYTHPDGRVEDILFPAIYADGRIHFDTERIAGSAWEVDGRTVFLTWSYKSDPGNYLCEMIQLSADGTQRARTWHWFDGDELVRRTLIKEQRVGAA
jgi:hypothetical protein